ncbi:CdaR family transcriptional regulator [Actinokineospora sp. UTMC 2448]|uniref:PucR family transcriptional regulator n=1 Tax=Actinokineospora sp. UTMC 2448 TaxID=2268449 RepID=UPI0021647EC7|nr:helix-turn-helix domain-containing protein [Actinokineospora sp. UTMC 2448]UVS78946.1 Sugar diacid utilization regulator [Actinokineospora sp. UTMC 2448]
MTAAASERGLSAPPIWAELVPEGVAKVRPLAGKMIADVVAAVRDAVPDYRRPLTGKFREVLVGGVEMAIMQCFRFIEDPQASRAEWLEVFRYAGRVEFLEGRTMDSLQTAVRVGARTVWRHLGRAGQELGMSADALLTLAEAIFAYVDDICVVAVAGYTEAQAQASGSYERKRRQLLKLVLSDQPGQAQPLADLAAAVDWPLPGSVAVVVLEYRPDHLRMPPPSLGRDVLVDLESTDPCLILPDPDPAAVDALRPALAGRRAAIGPAVPLADAHRSRAVARRALALRHRRILPDTDLIHCDRHLGTLLMFADEPLVAHMAERVRAVLHPLTTKQRDRAATTLHAWLRARGDVNTAATLLAVHPQTVRYRLTHLESLLGDHLANPEDRFLMEVAAHAWLPPAHQPKPADPRPGPTDPAPGA